MSKVISIHSFRGGTGKSNTTANIAALLANSGKKIAVVDTDIQSPGIHVPFGLSQDIQYSLNDYLWGICDIQKAAYDITESLNISNGGKLFIIPSSIKIDDITRALHEGYDVNMLNEGFKEIVKGFDLDILLIDTHPGLNDDTLLSIALSDTLIIVMRPDHQDYQGTDITVEVAKQLEVPQLQIIVNKVPRQFDSKEIKIKVENAYNCYVTAVIPHSDDLMILASEGIFALEYPQHELSRIYKDIAMKLL